MNNLCIPARDIEINYPSTWEEIEGRHVVRIGKIMYQCYKGEIDYDIARKMAVDLFINRVNSLKKPEINEESMNYWGNEAILADSVNFLFKRVKGRKEIENITIDPKFCIQPAQSMKIGFRQYNGPRDLLSDLTVYEFKETSWRVMKYAETKDDGYLDEIFAVLYKSGGLLWRRKHRQEGFNEKDYNRSLKAANKVQIGLKFTIFLFFIGCMNWVREESIEIDGVEVNFGCLFPRKKSSETDEGHDDKTGMAGILFQMAESGVFGNMEQTKNVNIWDFFLRLYQIHNQIKAMKAEMK
jgi:hypothetical protein